MKFPEVTQLGAADVEGAGRFLIFMVKDDWEPNDGHDYDHATGGCTCPCYPPLVALENAAIRSRMGTAEAEYKARKKL